mmetsp:Transcript_7181/g.9086  ORF Transcript_7181/g.9086 Transcript_7181/m.9086 type:complete len:133 (+) Transcript_7181:32-430(+)
MFRSLLGSAAESARRIGQNLSGTARKSRSCAYARKHTFVHEDGLNLVATNSSRLNPVSGSTCSLLLLVFSCAGSCSLLAYMSVDANTIGLDSYITNEEVPEKKLQRADKNPGEELRNKVCSNRTSIFNSRIV